MKAFLKMVFWLLFTSFLAVGCTTGRTGSSMNQASKAHYPPADSTYKPSPRAIEGKCGGCISYKGELQCCTGSDRQPICDEGGCVCSEVPQCDQR